jgi:hypothetical protein
MRVITSSPRIYTDEHGLKHRDLTEKLIGLFFSIYNELGHGFLESVYEQAFACSASDTRIFDNSKKNPRKSVLISGEEVKSGEEVS